MRPTFIVQPEAALRAFIVAALSLWVCGPAWAEAPADFTGVDAKLRGCMAQRGDTPGVNNCYSIAVAAADRRLNDVYGGLVNALKHPADPIAERDNPEILRRLVAAERGWIAFRDAHCNYQSTIALGGTGESTEFIACVYAQTKARVAALTAPDAPRNAR
jgi:uncharacterized protein YecT (DUF1311 family)